MFYIAEKRELRDTAPARCCLFSNGWVSYISVRPVAQHPCTESGAVMPLWRSPGRVIVLLISRCVLASMKEAYFNKKCVFDAEKMVIDITSGTSSMKSVPF